MPPKGILRGMRQYSSRRRFVNGVITAAAAARTFPAAAQRPGSIMGFDHVALPLRDTEAMLAFYRRLGLEVREGASVCSVYIGQQMINFHRPSLWQNPAFTLRAPAAQPPCGDLCFVWDGTAESVKALLDRAGAKIIEGPVERQGGRKKAGSSIYVRDPDGNLIEFIIYV